MLLKAAQWCKIVLNSYFHVLDLISIGVLFKRTAWNSKIRLLRRISQENHYQTFFLGHPVQKIQKENFQLLASGSTCLRYKIPPMAGQTWWGEKILKRASRKLHRLQNGNIWNLEGRKTSVPLSSSSWGSSSLVGINLKENYIDGTQE